MRIPLPLRVLSVILAFVVMASAAPASKTPPPASTSASESPPPLPWKIGPAQIELGHDLSLALPAEHRFLAAGPAAKVLEKMGGFHNENLLGVVTSQGDED